MGLISGTGRKNPWRRKWQPTPVFLPRKFHGQKNMVGYSPWRCRVQHDWEHTHKERKWANTDQVPTLPAENTVTALRLLGPILATFQGLLVCLNTGKEKVRCIKSEKIILKEDVFLPSTSTHQTGSKWPPDKHSVKTQSWHWGHSYAQTFRWLFGGMA